MKLYAYNTKKFASYSEALAADAVLSTGSDMDYLDLNGSLSGLYDLIETIELGAKIQPKKKPKVAYGVVYDDRFFQLQELVDLAIEHDVNDFGELMKLAADLPKKKAA